MTELREWRVADKWPGTAAGKLKWKARTKKELRLFLQGDLESYTLGNFADKAHQFAVARKKAQLRATGMDSASIIMATKPGGRMHPPKMRDDDINQVMVDDASLLLSYSRTAHRPASLALRTCGT